MTTSSQTFTQDMPALVGHAVPGQGVLARLRQRVASARCQLHGHDPNLCFDRERLFLYCSTCRLESPGWSLDGPSPRLRQTGAPDRYRRYAWLTASSAIQSRVESGDLVIY